MNNTITEMNTTLEGMSSRLDVVVSQIGHLEDNVTEDTHSEQQKEKNECKGPIGQHQSLYHLHHRDNGGKETKELRTYLKK